MGPAAPATSPDHGPGLSLPGLRRIRTLLARAMVADPMMTWVFPDPDLRLEACAAWLGLFVEHDAAVGGVDVLGADPRAPAPVADLGPGAEPGPRAVAVWRTSPGATPPPPSLPSVGGLLGALVGVEHARAVGRGLAAVREVTPARPHAYLHLAAVEPTLQGRGLGRAVLQPGLRRADATGLGVHLETTNPRAVPFYERLGFTVSAERTLGPDGPRLWAMWREPASA